MQIIVPQNTPTKLDMHGSQRPIFQNLGPGTLYFGTSNINVASNGIKMPVNAVYELPTSLVEGAGEIWFVAVDGSCDVRALNVG
jgi:hypothetical protein